MDLCKNFKKRFEGKDIYARVEPGFRWIEFHAPTFRNVRPTDVASDPAPPYSAAANLGVPAPTATAVAGPAFCPSCGTKNVGGPFCSGCGAKF